MPERTDIQRSELLWNHSFLYRGNAKLTRMVEKNILKKAIVVGADSDMRINIAAQLTKNTAPISIRAPRPGSIPDDLFDNSYFIVSYPARQPMHRVRQSWIIVLRRPP